MKPIKLQDVECTKTERFCDMKEMRLKNGAKRWTRKSENEVRVIKLEYKLRETVSPRTFATSS